MIKKMRMLAIKKPPFLGLIKRKVAFVEVIWIKYGVAFRWLTISFDVIF